MTEVRIKDAYQGKSREEIADIRMNMIYAALMKIKKDGRRVGHIQINPALRLEIVRERQTYFSLDYQSGGCENFLLDHPVMINPHIPENMVIIVDDHLKTLESLEVPIFGQCVINGDFEVYGDVKK